MKALEKDRTRRYETANGFAADVQRFLSDEPIEARPPSTAYRLRKLGSRHRVALATTALVTLALLAATAVSVRQWSVAADAATRAMEETRRAREAETQSNQRQARLHNLLTEKAILSALAGDQVRADDAIALAEAAHVDETMLRLLRGIACYHRGENEAAEKYLEEVLTEQPQNMLARCTLAMAHVHAGNWNEAVAQMDFVAQSKQINEQYEDHESLILAHAILHFDTSESLRLLQDVADRHPSWLVARSLLGAAKAHMALEVNGTRLPERENVGIGSRYSISSNTS